jgi:hypothetical protein
MHSDMDPTDKHSIRYVFHEEVQSLSDYLSFSKFNLVGAQIYGSIRLVDCKMSRFLANVEVKENQPPRDNAPRHHKTVSQLSSLSSGRGSRYVHAISRKLWFSRLPVSGLIPGNSAIPARTFFAPGKTSNQNSNYTTEYLLERQANLVGNVGYWRLGEYGH